MPRSLQLGVLIQRTVPHTSLASASRPAVVELPARGTTAPQSAEREGLLDESERVARASEDEGSDAGDILAFAPESQVHEPAHDQSGTVLGLHNVSSPRKLPSAFTSDNALPQVALVLPQFCVTLLSTISACLAVVCRSCADTAAQSLPWSTPGGQLCPCTRTQRRRRPSPSPRRAASERTRRSTSSVPSRRATPPCSASNSHGCTPAIWQRE